MKYSLMVTNICILLAAWYMINHTTLLFVLIARGGGGWRCEKGTCLLVVKFRCKNDLKSALDEDLKHMLWEFKFVQVNVMKVRL